MKRTVLLILLTITIHAFGQQNNSPLFFTARNGSVRVSFRIQNVTHTIQYSTDSLNWSTYASETEISIKADESVCFRAETNQDSAVAFWGSYFSFSNGGIVEGSGNIMFLYGPDCPNLPLQPDAFAIMFYNCTSLTTAPALPATTLADSCYYDMFSHCGLVAVNL